MIEMDMYPKGKEPIVITLTRDDWEKFSCALSDVICWANGFIAGCGDRPHGLISIDELRSLNLHIKRVL